MEKNQSNIILWIGVAANVLLLVFFVYTYFNSAPKESDLIQTQISAKPRVYDQQLDKELSSLKKVSDLPISIDPNELGKQNPYNN
ncbi:MAG: hypothetical protein PHU42_03765 [Patescibacteria group bacterium]|nr:hypothetical protein [Patescibacteria group bacterium]